MSHSFGSSQSTELKSLRCTVGSHSLFQFTSRVCSAAQSCLTLCDPVDCSPLGSSVHGISRQEYWSGLPFPSPGDLPHPGIKPMILASACSGRRILRRCASRLHAVVCICQCTLSVCPALSSPVATSTSLLSVCISIPALQTGLLEPFCYLHFRLDETETPFHSWLGVKKRFEPKCI